MKAFNQYLKKRKTTITLLLQKPPQSFTPDTFHTLRVEIKKLHALFDLVDFCSNGFKQNKTFKPFKLIFRQAGKVRELQVELSLIEKHFFFNLPKDYNTYLKKELTKELKIYFSIINSKSSPNLKKKYRKITSFLTNTSKKKTQCYIHKKRAKIQKFFRQNTLKNKQIHLLRKRLKKLQYSEKILKDNKKNRLFSNKDNLTDLLGEWHDYELIINHLKKVIYSGSIHAQETNQLENIKATFKFKRNLLFNKLNTFLLHNIFKNN
ncbi:CHAD domain-containing protein [Flavobacterium sp. ZT3R25]|uniref:CHAD domain-containing protein n=1 Tax=Flavobacterium galactosi TaxID=3398735 RepID=UPI003A893A1F